jgi:predicted Na+-dependent transporter
MDIEYSTFSTILLPKVISFLTIYIYRWCSLFNADLALSVTMTAISTILSVIALPINLLLYAKFSYDADVTSDLDWISVFFALGVVISAITMGLYMSYQCHSYKFNMMANKVGNLAGFALIIFSATVTNTGDADSKIWSRHWTFYVATMIPCILGLTIASILASLLNLRKPERM